MSSAARVADNLRQYSRNIVRNLNQAKINAVGQALDAAIWSTRVDTEHARSNWHAQVGSPFGGINGVRAYGANRGGAQAFAQSMAAARQARPGQPIWITNNVPYIVYLDRGTSKISADQMMMRAVGAATEYLRTVRVLEMNSGGTVSITSGYGRARG